MDFTLYVLSAILLLVFAYIVFRRIVRRDYLQRERLSLLSSLLELLVFAGVMSFPELYNPPEWAWFWKIDGSMRPVNMIIGLIVIICGFTVAFGTMFWFGISRAFGVKTDGIVNTGPYRFSRNPQILGGYLLVLGVFIQWPSWYALGWVILYGVISHMMILTEEEYLTQQYGETYTQFLEKVPRYLFKMTRRKGAGD